MSTAVGGTTGGFSNSSIPGANPRFTAQRMKKTVEQKSPCFSYRFVLNVRFCAPPSPRALFSRRLVLALLSFESTLGS